MKESSEEKLAWRKAACQQRGKTNQQHRKQNNNIEISKAAASAWRDISGVSWQKMTSAWHQRSGSSVAAS